MIDRQELGSQIQNFPKLVNMSTLLGNMLRAEFEKSQTVFASLSLPLRGRVITELLVILKSLLRPECRQATAEIETQMHSIFVQV